MNLIDQCVAEFNQLARKGEGVGLWEIKNSFPNLIIRRKNFVVLLPLIIKLKKKKKERKVDIDEWLIQREKQKHLYNFCNLYCNWEDRILPVWGWLGISWNYRWGIHTWVKGNFAYHYPRSSKPQLDFHECSAQVWDPNGDYKGNKEFSNKFG